MPNYRRLLLLMTMLFAIQALQGCRSSAAESSSEAIPSDPCAIALAPINNEESEEIRLVNSEISRLQEAARKAGDPKPYIERLGWKFVEKARVSYDPGNYKIAEQCAACIEGKAPKRAKSEAAMLLRGHVLHSLHRFKEAEAIARELAKTRGRAFDHGLLGDVLMEQGKLEEAIASYQKMMDLKPGPQAYSRAAHIRWLRGDLNAARVMIRMAAQGAGAGDREAAAWAYSRLAFYELQAGAHDKAAEACNMALSLQKDYAPALLACGRVMLAEDRESAAIAVLQQAAKLNPLPEYQWTLADAYRAANRESEALAVEAQLKSRGEADDPRTYSLYLATRGEASGEAIRLAEKEMGERRDIFTLDAMAWALVSAGRFDEAHKTMRQALAEGTQDARLFFHAAVIAAKSGRREESQRYFRKAAALKSLLLPGERKMLESLIERLAL